jgi:hypothetical protein
MTLNPYFVTFELVILFTFVLCLIHAWRAGIAAVLQLVAGVGFGLLLELATIRQLNAYRYGQFTVMVFDVPLVIGVAWGCLIYSVRGYTNALSVPEWTRPVLDALLVLTVDLSMDAIAIRLGMWDWGKGLQFQYFGVPFANFWAWSWVVFSFSAGLRLLTHRPGWVATWLAPWGAMVIGVLGVMFSNELITFWVPRSLYEATVAALFITAIALVLVLRPRLMRPPDPLAGQVALIQHIFFFGMGLVSGILLQQPFLLGVSILMLTTSLIVYHGPELRRLVTKTS